MRPQALAALPDGALLEAVQRQTFRYFWEGAHPASGLTPDRRATRGPSQDDPVAVGGTGFAVMALLAAIERGWVTRDAALERLGHMLDVLCRATRFHGAFPHFMNGATGATIPFAEQDDGGDIVETSFLFMGLLCARQYFQRDTPAEAGVRARITGLWDSVDWNWYTRGRAVLYWHWSPVHGWAIDLPIRGWNECLVTYVLAAASQRHAIAPDTYHLGFGADSYRVDNAPLFFAHYSFCGLDPRGLKDRHADYWELNLAHVRANRAHCIANPGGHAGYGPECWGLTASDGPDAYEVHAPDCDNGTISPTAALASMPYAPREALQVARHLLAHHGAKLWGRYGFADAFCERLGWHARTCLAIDQGPIVVMIENHRSGLLWKLFMSVPEVQAALRRLGFTSPWLA
jgi:hypothetical protein